MDGLRLLRGVLAPPVSAVGLDGRAHPPPAQVAAAPRPAAEAAAAPPRLSYMSTRPVRRLWPAGDGDLAGAAEKEADAAAAGGGSGGGGRGNWVINILRVRSLWKEEDRGGGDGDGETAAVSDEEAEEVGPRCVGCDGAVEDVEEGEGNEASAAASIDSEWFGRLLRRVSLVEAELYAKMSYLSTLAYSIPKIKPSSLLKYHGLHFVTSSLEIKAKSISDEKEQTSAQHSDPEPEKKAVEAKDAGEQRENGNGMNASTAYQIAAAAASYVQSQTKGILPFGSSNNESGKDSPEGGSDSDDKYDIASSEMASFVATTSSVTAVVAGKEEMKQAVAKDLNSLHSSPCEWFICDDDRSSARYFVIQGSESLASWQANLLFEPIQFEGLDVFVHRGIYEAAKGIYQQMLPEIQAHLKSRGKSATLRFTGHSLGGSLAMLVNLMLVIRGDAPPSSLLPVITFGAPTIMCGGDYLLKELGLPQSHVQAVVMHRDIVPRAFSCSYPDHVTKILATVNGKFRNHPCLKNQKLLYAPMGKLLILQPEEKFSPHHHLLPPGSGLYLFDHPLSNSGESMKIFQAAQFAFLNSPHPLEILSDRSAYGSDGSVFRDHDMNAYLSSVQAIIRRDLKQIRKAKREHRRLLWWPIVSVQSIQSDAAVGRQSGLLNSTGQQFNFTRALHGGKETLKRFGRMVASQHVHIVVVLLFPARLLIGTLSFVSSR